MPLQNFRSACQPFIYALQWIIRSKEKLFTLQFLTMTAIIPTLKMRPMFVCYIELDVLMQGTYDVNLIRSR